MLCHVIEISPTSHSEKVLESKHSSHLLVSARVAIALARLVSPHMHCPSNLIIMVPSAVQDLESLHTFSHVWQHLVPVLLHPVLWTKWCWIRSPSGRQCFRRQICTRAINAKNLKKNKNL